MKTKLLIASALLVFVSSVFTGCSKKEESPEPVSSQQQQTPNNPNDPNDPPPPPPPPPPPTDTTSLFTDNAWITKKVEKNGADQPNHFLINSSWKFNTDGSYLFSIPNFPSASGTWEFDINTKAKVSVTNQSGTNTWNIAEISTDKMVVEEQEGSDTYRFEYSH